MSVAAALLAIGAADPARARTILAACPADDDLAAALRRLLDRQASGGVYDDPTAFQSFIDHGGNPALYAAAIDAVAALHRTRRPTTVLDIGCGDGRVTAAVLGPSTTVVDLVEPSPEMIAAAAPLVAGKGATVRAHTMGIEDALTADTSTGWDLVQSTFALHNLPPPRRAEVLTRLVTRSGLLALVEFDVAAFADGSPEHAAYCEERYRRGIAEYAEHPEVVDGFLMPVLAGQFDPTRVRATHEQPASAWAAELTDAGFVGVEVTPVLDYWWAPAVLVTGTGRRD